jgi:fumarate reductase subunit C
MRQPLDVIDAERVTPDSAHRPSGRAAARRELYWEILSGGTGFLLTVFIWFHVFDVGSLLFGPEGFDHLAEFLEGLYIAQPIVIIVALLFFAHAVAAARKIPARVRERRRFNRLARELDAADKRWIAGEGTARPHEDSRWWVWQLRTGMLILVLGSFHVGLMTIDTFTALWGERHGMEAATTMERVAAGLSWFYLLLLVLLAIHASVGVYRLAIKWGVGAGRSRPALKRFARIFGLAFLAAGVFVLAVMAGWLPPPFAFLLGS